MQPENDPASRLHELRNASQADLKRALFGGHSIAPEALQDTCYRGISLGLPSWIESLSWTTFMKTFHQDPDSGLLRGWNVRLEQTGLEGPIEPMRDLNGRPKTFGHYEVVQATQTASHRAPNGLLIDYGRGRNSRLDPIGRLRDPIVALEENSVDTLLGWSYLDLGFAMPTPSYFLLQRCGPLDHVAHPPRRL